MWKQLLRWAFLGGIAFYLYFGNTDVVYEATASFKEGIERVSSESFFKELIGGIGQVVQPQTASLMKSNRVLKPLAEKLGCQIQPKIQEWKLAKLFRRYKESLRAERGGALKEVDSFVFGNVHYEKEESFPFQIVFFNEEEYAVFDEHKKEKLTSGKLNNPCVLAAEEFSFTLKKAPHSLKLNQFYPFVAHPWISAVGDLKGRIKIKNDKDNASILILSAAHRDRYFAAEIVNELIHEYQAYLKREYDTVAIAQLAYLEGKQEQIASKMDQLFDQHIDYLGKNLDSSGFIGLDQEVQSLMGPYHQMYDKLLSIDVELKRLDERENSSIVEGNFLSQGFVQKIQELKQQRDLIELSFAKYAEPILANRTSELKEIREARLSLEKLSCEFSQGKELAASDIGPELGAWAKMALEPEEKEDLAEYLAKTARLLSMREKMEQARFFHGKDVPEELNGIDLASARSLFLEYNNKLDAVEATLRHYAQLKAKIPDPHFDLASLSTVLSDALSQKIIGSVSDFEMQLKDEKHYSAKEEKRWQSEIALQRKILVDHLDQLVKVEELSATLMRDKMSALQRVSLDCINQQISVLQEQIHDALKEKKKALSMEKEILTKKMGEISALLAKVMPEKWRFEKWLEIKTAMVSKVMETVTEVVESKTMTNQLHHVESKPLDLAFVPTVPLSSHLRQMFYLGALVFPTLIFSFAFIRRLLKGFPADFEKLKAIHFPLLGEISPFCDGPLVETFCGKDLELLRNMALFGEEAKVIGLIGGKGPDYSYAFAENLARRNIKSVILRCDFLSKMSQEDAPGILHICKEEAFPSIRQGKGFDYIPAGGYTPFGLEMIQSEPFQKLLSSMKKNYDKVFLLFKGSLSSVESQAALRLCEKAIVTVSSEQIEELTPFIHWGYDGDNCRITFITRA